MHYKRLLYGKKPMAAPPMVRGKGWEHSEGYIYHGTRGLHRKVVEQAIGRPLIYSEIVHHIDGNKKNNDLSNLEIMDRARHVRMHTKGKTNDQRRVEKEKYGYCLPDFGGQP